MPKKRNIHKDYIKRIHKVIGLENPLDYFTKLKKYCLNMKNQMDIIIKNEILFRYELMQRKYICEKKISKFIILNKLFNLKKAIRNHENGKIFINLYNKYGTMCGEVNIGLGKQIHDYYVHNNHEFFHKIKSEVERLGLYDFFEMEELSILNENINDLWKFLQ